MIYLDILDKLSKEEDDHSVDLEMTSINLLSKYYGEDQILKWYIDSMNSNWLYTDNLSLFTTNTDDYL